MKILSNKRYKELLKAEEDSNNGYISLYNNKLKIMKDRTWEQYLEILRLKREIKKLNEVLSRKIIEEIGEPKHRRVK